MRTSRKTDFRKLKISLVTMTYHSQRPQCPSLSPHVLVIKLVTNFTLFCYCYYLKLTLKGMAKTIIVIVAVVVVVVLLLLLV